MDGWTQVTQFDLNIYKKKKKKSKHMEAQYEYKSVKKEETNVTLLEAAEDGYKSLSLYSSVQGMRVEARIHNTFISHYNIAL